MGVRCPDHPGVASLLDAMLRHQDDSGRFASLSGAPSGGKPVWGSLPCDAHGILDVLLRFDRADDSRTAAAVERVRLDFTTTGQGPGWACLPHSASGWRGPGRRGDLCPQVTLEALRLYSYLPPGRRPPQLLEAGRSLLGVWRNRGSEKPYMFGHGRQFKTVKWPPFWYSALAVAEVLGCYPELWRDARARREDREALAEIAACLVAYNFTRGGRVIPQSCYRGFESFSFGQKKLQSALATVRLCVALRRLDDLVDDISAVDVTRLTSSKGGGGTALPPRPIRDPS
jgi:hypothetical protein